MYIQSSPQVKYGMKVVSGPHDAVLLPYIVLPLLVQEYSTAGTTVLVQQEQMLPSSLQYL